MVLQEKLLSRSSFGVEYVKIALGVLLLFACSQIRIPMDPVPITFQTTAVLLIGLTYARFSTSFMAVGSYLALGALGLPVFNGYSAGFAYMSGPTFGYLLGFLIAISVMYGAKRVVTLKSQAVKNTLLCLFGLASIYLCGLLWLSHLFGFEKALSVGFMPFIGPELLKSVTLVGLVRLIRN